MLSFRFRSTRDSALCSWWAQLTGKGTDNIVTCCCCCWLCSCVLRDSVDLRLETVHREVEKFGSDSVMDEQETPLLQREHEEKVQKSKTHLVPQDFRRFNVSEQNHLEHFDTNMWEY